MCLRMNVGKHRIGVLQQTLPSAVITRNPRFCFDLCFATVFDACEITFVGVTITLVHRTHWAWYCYISRIQVIEWMRDNCLRC